MIDLKDNQTTAMLMKCRQQFEIAPFKIPRVQPHGVSRAVRCARTQEARPTYFLWGYCIPWATRRGRDTCVRANRPLHLRRRLTDYCTRIGGWREAMIAWFCAVS